MPHLIEIAFKGNRKEFFLWESDELPARAAAVIVDADRGEDLGRVVAVGVDAESRSAKVPHGLFGAAPSRIVKRVATGEELHRHEEVRASDDDARRKAMERVKANALIMNRMNASGWTPCCHPSNAVNSAPESSYLMFWMGAGLAPCLCRTRAMTLRWCRPATR